MAKETARYSLDRKGVLLRYGSIAAAGVIAGGSVIAMSSCSKQNEQWAETSGQAGHINLEAVEEAMQKSRDVTDFEKRVNEIYQGNEMVLIEVKNEANGEQLVSGYSDLNNNEKIDYDEDEKLFTFRRWNDNNKPNYEMRGYGVNSYYYHPFPSGMDLFTTWFLISALSRPAYATMPVYHTTVPQTIRTYRDGYRKTPSYRDQINTNRSFESKMSSTHGVTYRQASPTSARQRWATRSGVNLDKATKISSKSSGGFKSSWGGSKGSRGFFGGFKGGGTGGGIAKSGMVRGEIFSKLSVR